MPPGLTLGGVNFTINTAQSNGTLFVVDGGFPNNLFHVTLLDSQFSSSISDNILITLPQPVTAAAFDVGSNTNTTFTFTLSTGDTFTSINPGNHNIQFLGLTSTTPFTSIEISQPASSGVNALVLTDFTFGTAIPEPGSFSLLATGGLGLLGYRLRRRQTITCQR